MERQAWASISLTLNENLKMKTFFFGYAMQWLDMGSQFPDEGLNPHCSDEHAES